MTFRIDISHNLILYKLLYYKLECMGWEIQANAQLDNPSWTQFPNQVGNYFALDVEKKSFHWIGGEDCEGNGHVCDLLATMEDVETLMEFIKENVDLMKNVPVPVDPPKPTWKPMTSEPMWGTNPCKEVPLDYPDPYKYYYTEYEKPKSYQYQIDKLLAMKKQLIEYYNEACYYNDSHYKQEAIKKKIYAIEDELANLGDPQHAKYKKMGGLYDKYGHGYGGYNDPYYNDPYSSPYKYKKGGYGW
jgi:hypothetical protein